MSIRLYDPKKDFDAVRRLWEEIAWIDRDNKGHAKSLKTFLEASHNLVAELNDEAECLVANCPGTIRHLETDVSMTVISAVTTSLIARKQGFASRVTAKSIADGAAAGMATAALGMFEQGYYTRLGFGNGSYENIVRFNPANLNVDVDCDVPVRLGKDDAADMHNALMKRWRSHGSVQVLPVEHWRADLGWTDEPVGLGFRNEKGELTHFIWGNNKGENGPLRIHSMAYQNRQQLMELMALIKSLGNQLLLVRLTETQHLQMQDLIDLPFRSQNKSEGGKYAESIRSEAWWQLRINDMAACIGATHLPGRPTLSFNATIDDPITRYLDKDEPWQGISGEYTIHLGEDSELKSGHTAGLPLLTASTSGISRLWLGAASANRLATSGEIIAEQSLLDQLEQTLALPTPRTGWEF